MADKPKVSEAFSVPVFRFAYGPRYRVYTDISGESMTKQSFKDECDINIIMRRYESSGVIPWMQEREPRFIDASGYDFQEAMFLVAAAKSAFAELPARMRERFDNDPSKLMAFIQDDKNREEAISLGLVDPKAPEAAPVKVEVVGPPAAATPAAGGVPAVPAAGPGKPVASTT